MNVEQIIATSADRLREKGYSGLYSPDCPNEEGCGCALDDLAHCGCDSETLPDDEYVCGCLPGYKFAHPNGYDYFISSANENPYIHCGVMDKDKGDE